MSQSTRMATTSAICEQHSLRDIVLRIEVAVDHYIDRLADEARLARDQSRRTLSLDDKLLLQRRAKLLWDHRKRVLRQRFEIIDQTCSILRE